MVDVDQGGCLDGQHCCCCGPGERCCDCGQVMPRALADIATERNRQISVKGWSPDHDDAHRDGSLAAAAVAYAFSAATAERYFAADPLGFWPWDPTSWKPRSPREDLVRAGALIAAEIERIDRAVIAQVSE